MIDTLAHVVSVKTASLKAAGDNMKELWKQAIPTAGTGADERLLLCAHASQVTIGPLTCSASSDCWFFSIDSGSRLLYLLWLSDHLEESAAAAEALHASLSAFTDGATAHAAAADSLVASGLSRETAAAGVGACKTVELIKNLCWLQASHMLFPMWHAVCKGERSIRVVTSAHLSFS